MLRVFHKARPLALAACLCAAGAAAQAVAEEYRFPFTDPYVATVVGTPSDYRARLPRKYARHERSLVIFPQRRVPRVLWYARAMRYAVAPQDDRAPLVFVIAGTGASYESSNMRLLEAALHQAGYHVVSISSPTHPGFLVSASETGVPGDLASDSRDLYRVMERIWAELSDEIEASGFYLTGYSLGGAQSAFVARIDEAQKSFNFRSAVMINPPVSLYRSVTLLDAVLEQNLRTEEEFLRFYERAMQRVSEIYLEVEEFDFNDDFLFRAYEGSRRSAEELRPTLETLVGLAFRLSAANMFFTSDVMTAGGFFVPPGIELGRTDSLTDYGKIAVRTSFNTYLREYMLPFMSARTPGTTLQSLIAASSLESIEDYLADSPKIRMVTNADDIILSPGEIDYLRALFGERGYIFPSGGHCGNLATPAFLKRVIRLFGEEPT
jgi:predicted alpha/beta-fold hydrolase